MKRAVLLLALLLTACWHREPPPVAYDLAAIAPVADSFGAWTLLRPATADGRRAVVSGLDPAPPDAGLFAFARRQVALRFDWKDVKARTLALDVEPLEGTSRLGVRVNGRRVARIDVGAGRRTYAVPIPVDALQAGLNTVDVRFDDATETDDGARHAAKVWTIGLAEGQVEPGPGPLFDRQGDVVRLASSGLAFGVLGATRAELRFSATANGPGTLRVGWQPDGGAATELWRRQTDASASWSEVAIDLPKAEGAAGRLTIAFDGGAPDARLELRGARVHSDVAPAPLALTPWAPADLARADTLRATTKDAPLVLVVLDAARARELGAYGYARPTTPRLDRLAREAVVFERAYTPAVFTLAAISSLWTSLPPAQHHAGVPYDSPLPSDHLTLAELLAASGREAAGFVGNTRAGAAYGMERGFTHWAEAKRQSSGEGATELLDLSRAWLKSRRDGRFFLYLHLREPHFPYEPPPPFDALFPGSRVLPEGALRDSAWYRQANQEHAITPAQADELVRAYDRNLAYADAKYGELEDELRAQGLWDRALVIVTADHGEALGEHDFISHNEQVYEESTHVPLLVKLPSGAGMRDVRNRALLSTLDLAPTLADAAGLAARAGNFQGRSLLPLLAGASGRPAVISRAAGEESLYGVRYERYKCLVKTRWGGDELYDLDADPAEKQDLARVQPGRLLECRQALHRHVLETRPRKASTGREQKLDPGQLENLKALGYIQ